MLLFYLAAVDTEEERDRLSEIYETHKHAMHRYALSITKNKETAEDAVHNAFLAIINHKEKYFSLPCRDLRILCVIITKNKCIDLLRKQGKLSDTSLDEMENSLVSKDEPPEEKLIKLEEYETIKKHMSTLDEKSRSVLEMKYLLDMSYKEIGEALNMTPKHVDTTIMRAKAKVRKIARERSED